MPAKCTAGGREGAQGAPPRKWPSPEKTHSIGELRSDLLRAQVNPGLSEDDADLLDTIYLPSKYPLGSVLPHFEPDAEMARRCVAVADQVLAVAAKRFSPE